MRIPVNLAREPFRRDRPMLIGSALAGLLLLGTLGLLISMIVTENRESQEAKIALDRVNRQLANVHREQAKLDAAMRLPGNEIVLDRSVFINQLIKRKAISWTRIFADLEKVLPPNVRILAVRPAVNAQDQVFLDLTVAADAPEPVISFIIKLEESDVFGSTAVSTIVPPTQTDPFYRYRLSVNYAQKL
jgi:Tfp pilus assembly protein PilN